MTVERAVERKLKASHLETKVIDAALALHLRWPTENLYADNSTYELVRELDDSCAALLNYLQKNGNSSEYMRKLRERYGH